jgi:hypothetical protein
MDVVRQALTSSSPSAGIFRGVRSATPQHRLFHRNYSRRSFKLFPGKLPLTHITPLLLVPASPVQAVSPSPRMVTHIRPSHSSLVSPDPNTLVLLVHGGVGILITRLEERW